MRQKNSFEKAWFVLSPFVIYRIVKYLSMWSMVIIVQQVRLHEKIVSMLPFLGAENLCATVINGISSIIGVSFIYRRFLEETTFRGEYDPDANVFRQTWMRLQTSVKVHKKKWLAFVLLCIFAGCSAIAMNLVMSILPVTSDAYGRVANIQYSVPVWLGIILYGVLAPIAEEIVFRGMMYNRMKRCFPMPISMILTSFMFGAFHGNVVQMIYAMILGVLMILVYEWLSSFWGPLLFHMSANVVIYLCSTLFPDMIAVTVWSCCAFSVGAVVAGIGVYFFSRKG